MLSEDLYTILEQSGTELIGQEGEPSPGMKLSFMIRLNPAHPVYGGHFPGNPVVPGVYQVQIVKELASLVLQKELIIRRSDNIKYLSMIVPSLMPLLKIILEIKEKEPGSWQVTATIMDNEQALMKFRGIMLPAEGLA